MLRCSWAVSVARADYWHKGRFALTDILLLFLLETAFFHFLCYASVLLTDSRQKGTTGL